MLVSIIWSCNGGEPEHVSAVNKQNETEVMAVEEQVAPDVTSPPSPQVPTPPLSKDSVERIVYFTNQNNFQTGQGDFLEGVPREFSPRDTPQSAIEQIYNGPNESETGLVFTSCESTGATLISINDGLAIVQLKGGCSGCGTHSVYDSLRATLKEWPEISDIVLLGPNEAVNANFTAGRRPRCLEP